MDKKKLTQYGIGIGIAVVIITALIFLNNASNGQSTSLLGQFNQAEQLTPDELVKEYRYDQLHLDPKKSILVEDLRTNFVNVGVSNRTETPLLTEVAENESVVTEEEDLPEVVPWFYFSPNVAIVSPTSYVNNYRLIEKESINGFAWYERDGVELLSRNGKLYTGWYNIVEEGWFYFLDGVQQDEVSFSIQEAEDLIKKRNHLIKLVSPATTDFFFVERPYEYTHMSIVRPVDYSILYKNTESMILTAPPKTQDSTLITTTEAFYDMPMEVVEEYESFDGTWLHVYIGYEELGWVKKDETGVDYVDTFYSERELLDTIESVIWEEIGMIDANVGASFINNETMAQVDINNQQFFPASTQKIYVLGEIYHQYKTGELSPDTYVTMEAWDKVPGAGVIQGYSDGSMFSVDELVDLVTIYSDNTAANLLIDTAGGGSIINPHVHQLGMYETYVTGKYYDYDSYFVTTPHDAARYFALLYNDQINGAPWDEMLIGKLTMNTHNFLRQYIPYSTSSWNKSGLGETEQNDVATFVTPYGTYSLAVYTAYPANYDAISDQLGMLSLRVHDVFNELRSQLWITVED
ncbi:serine hydrolase [Aerococcaceae bacterium WGS1372]